MIILSAEHISQALSMKEAIQAVEDGFTKLSLNKVLMPQRTTLTFNNVWHGIMPCILLNEEKLSIKLVSVAPDNKLKGLPTTSAQLALIDAHTGQLLALMEATLLTAMRTGAASAIATKYLALKNIESLGIIGAGFQARFQLKAIREVRAFKRALVFDVVKRAAEKFANEMSKELGLDIMAVDSAKQVASKSEVIVTATTSKTPVLLGEWVNEGVHVNAIGAHTPDARELDDDLIMKSKLVVDQREACLREAGDLIIPISKGLFSQDKIYAELGEITSGSKPGRTTDDEITVFKSVGLAVQDAAVAKVAYEKAVKMGIGYEVKL